MTDRLYYTDAKLLAFDAVARAYGETPTQLILDRSAFYPTSGGQPHDTGTINGTAVVDVIDAGDDVMHITAEPVSLGPVHGIVDGARRYDLMQQHSAQHLLSALAADRLGWDTASVHFGSADSSIEFSVPAASLSAREQLEAWANSICREGRAVSITFESSAEAAASPLRKASDREGVLRIITIAGIDRSACGGTHVGTTSEIGAILLGETESVRENIRLHFRAGDRVLRHAHAADALLAGLATTWQCGVDELTGLAATRQQELAALRRQVAASEMEVAAARVGRLYDAATPGHDDIRAIRYVAADDPASLLRQMALQGAGLVRARLIITDPGQRTIYFGTSADSGLDAGAQLKAALASVGGRGGGNARLAQGSVGDVAALHALAESL
ncbi:MAG TPA: hypothetical protein VGM77_05140 [Gemmatimonadales bacterium]|jgi:alanyl-tRNA synthetase